MIVIRETVEFTAWIDDLRDLAGRRRIVQRLTRVAEGQFGDVKNVGDSVSEMRFHFGPGYRVYFTRRESDGVLIILLAGGDKDSQFRDIVLAKQLARRELEDE